MIATYVVLDGFDLGAGAIYLIAAKTNDERRRVLRAIGPVWDGNEVWLLAAGGTLYFAFPQLYASSFSGFYLPLTIVLWLLILRAIGIEFRAHIETVKSGRTFSTWSSAFPAFCWLCFSGQHWATWCAEFRSTQPAISLSRSGPPSNSVPRRASWIGTRSSPEWWR
jgi:cytochrome bd-type quinol oxidase subunit 2